MLRPERLFFGSRNMCNVKDAWSLVCRQRGACCSSLVFGKRGLCLTCRSCVRGLCFLPHSLSLQFNNCLNIAYENSIRSSVWNLPTHALFILIFFRFNLANKNPENILTKYRLTCSSLQFRKLKFNQIAKYLPDWIWFLFLLLEFPSARGQGLN